MKNIQLIHPLLLGVLCNKLKENQIAAGQLTATDY